MKTHSADEVRLAKALPPPIARRPGDTSPSMICRQVFDAMAIHANGDIVCWCVDVEGKHVYGNVFTDRIADVYNGPAYREIREWLLQSRPDTWCPAVEYHCPLRAVPASRDLKTTECRVKLLRLEPVTYCNLRCPVCPVETGFKQRPELTETRQHKMLPLDVMLDVIAQLPDLEILEYFDYGEPFLHKDTITFLREVRRTRPDLLIATNTNGTVLTPAQIEAIAKEGLLSRVIFSIDGATPESYKKYRIGGSFDKAFGKMKALAEACRAAGTWNKYGDGPRGTVQIVWQYILFEWNDSDEEIALARELAREADLPMTWIVTSGYGASKRFLPGSQECASLLNLPDFFIHLSANADIDDRLEKRGIDGITNYDQFKIDCDLLSLPYVNNNGNRKYQACIQSDEKIISVPRGSKVVFNVWVENKTDQNWDVKSSDYLRLGFRLETADNKPISELPGFVFPESVARPGGRDCFKAPIALPEQPGEYRLLVDVVQEWVCWFSDRGSEPFVFTIRLD